METNSIFVLKLSERLFYYQTYDNEYFRKDGLWYAIINGRIVTIFLIQSSNLTNLLETRYQQNVTLYQDTKSIAISAQNSSPSFRIGYWFCSYINDTEFHCVLRNTTYSYRRLKFGKWYLVESEISLGNVEYLEHVFEKAQRHFQSCASISNFESDNKCSPIAREFFNYVLRAFDDSEKFWQCEQNSTDFTCSCTNSGFMSRSNQTGDWLYTNSSRQHWILITERKGYLRLFENIYEKYNNAVYLYTKGFPEPSLNSITESNRSKTWERSKNSEECDDLFHPIGIQPTPVSSDENSCQISEEKNIDASKKLKIQKSKSADGDDKKTVEKVLPKLKERLESRYSLDCKWIKQKKWMDLKRKNGCFQLRIQRENQREPISCGIADVTASGAKRTLVRSYGLFGKTALLTRIALSWQMNKKSPFELCIFLDSNDFDVNCSVEENLIWKCAELVKCRSEVIEAALKPKSKKILILLDGLDSTSTEGKKAVQEFLEDAGVFGESTVVFASRPDDSNGQLRGFDAYIEIQGFEKGCSVKQVLRKRSIFSNLTGINKGMEDLLGKLDHLSGFPLPSVYDALEDILETKTTDASLFLLLKKVTEGYAERYSQKLKMPNNKEYLNEAFHKFGCVCLDYLVSGCGTFDEEALKANLGEHETLILNLGIFTELQFEERKTLICHKIFIVFFATLFLRNMWDKSPSSQQSILKRYFLFDDSIGEYLVSNTESYFLGALPEIVLCLGSNCSFDGAHFEMCYDLGDTDTSLAFEPTNVLLRLSKPFSRRFGFERVNTENVIRYHCIFEKVINCLDFGGGYAIDIDFYSNNRNGNDYMAITVNDSEDNKVILQGIFERNEKTCDFKMHIEFRFSNVETVLPFLVNTTQINSELFETSNLSDIDGFVMLCVLSFASRSSGHDTTVSIHDTNPKGDLNIPISFDLVFKEDSSCHIHARYLNIKTAKVKTGSISVNDLCEKFQVFATNLTTLCEEFVDPSITINVK